MPLEPGVQYAVEVPQARGLIPVMSIHLGKEIISEITNNKSLQMAITFGKGGSKDILVVEDKVFECTRSVESGDLYQHSINSPHVELVGAFVRKLRTLPSTQRIDNIVDADRLSKQNTRKAVVIDMNTSVILQKGAKSRKTSGSVILKRGPKSTIIKPNLPLHPAPLVAVEPLADFSRDKYVQQPEARRNIDTSDLRKTLIHVLAPGPADIQTLCDRLRLPESAIKKELDSSPEIAKLQSDKKTWQLRNDAYRELDARSWPYYTPEERELALKVAQQALAIRPSRMAPAPVSEPPAVVPKQPDTTTLPARVSTTTAATARTEPPLRPSAPSSMSSIATNKSGAKGRTGGERINKDPKGNPDSSYSSRLGPQSETQPGPSSGYRRQHPAPVVGDKPRESMIGRYEDDNETGKGEARHVRPNSRRATTTTAATAATTATATTAATTAAAATTTATAATATVASVTKPPSSAGFEEMYQQLEDRQRECDRLYSVFQKLRLVEATASGSQDESQIRTRLVELARDIGIAVSEGALIHSETHREDFKSQLVDVLRKQVEQYKKARQEATALYQAIQERFATEPCGEPDRS